jgi:acetyl esterase
MMSPAPRDVFADTELAEFIASLNALELPPAARLGATALRSAADERARERPAGPDMHETIEVELPVQSVSVRVYRPTPDADAVLVYLHGGGWVIGNLETHDRACRRLASTSGVVVVAVDYRTAPEHPWPAAVDDAVAAIEWIRGAPGELGRPIRRLGIAGDSAGGTIAALACLRLRDQGSDSLPSFVALIYPTTDLTLSGDSMDTKGHGFGLDRANIEWFNRQWVPDESRWADPDVSPLHADVAGFPPTLVVTCEHDPLRDQGEEFAARLAQAGGDVRLRRETGMVHNFALWDLVSPACAAAADRIAVEIGHALTTIHD